MCDLLVVSTVEPGRKPMDNDDSDHLQPNGDISADINNDIEMIKADNKLSTNGTADKHKNGNANESVVKAEIASSSGTSTVKASDEHEQKVAEAETKVASDQVADEKPAPLETVTTKPEPEPTNDDAEMVEKPTPSEQAGPVEAKPIVEPAVEEKPTEIEQTTASEKEVPESKKEKEEEIPAKIEEKTENLIQVDPELKIESMEANDASAPEPAEKSEEKPIETAKETKMEETVKKTPPTPKRAASGSDEEDGGDDDNASKNPCAKKIRLDLDASETKTAETEAAAVPEVDLEKAVDILDSISTEIDAQKESELLGEVNFISIIIV